MSLPGPPLHLLGVEHPQHGAEWALAADLPRQEEIAGDVQRRRNGQGLVDRLDPGVARVLRTPEMNLLAVDEDAALVRDQGARKGI